MYGIVQDSGHKYAVTDSKATNALSHRSLMTPKAAMMALRMGLDVYMASRRRRIK